MKQRTFIALAAVGLLIGVVAGPVLAAGDRPRYQFATTSYTVAVPDTYIHTFVVTTNPCDDSIVISGSTPVDSGYYTTETVTGTLTAGIISFSSTYAGPYDPGFTWSGSFPVGGGGLAGQYTGTVTAASTTYSTFRNHGDYVSSTGGGADAAHSCIGMPLASGKHSSGEASTATDPDRGMDAAALRARLAANEDRLLEILEGVRDRLDNAHATGAIQKHIDAITAGDTGLGHAAQSVGGGGDHPGHPDAPDSHGQSQDHPDKGNHPGKP